MTDGSDAAGTPKGDPSLLGRAIAGKFVVEKYLGGGAMGAVYKARQSALDKNVAVKVMHGAIAVDPSFVARFHREAKAASRLDHPNSVRVIDFGEEPDGLLYIAMEYLEGRDLYRVIHEDWPLDDLRIGDLMMQALAAIRVAHDMGVIHRDLKPENIMILRTKDDEGGDADLVKVCDFGIAKITEVSDKDDAPPSGGPAGQRLTTQGLVVGTPEYMSPEQARGEKLDARSDLYSMGIILYQLLTGRTPFMAETPLGVVLKHITEKPEPPSTIYPEVHKGLEAVAMKALAKGPGERFQTAREMRTAIRTALGARPQLVDTAAQTAFDLEAQRLGTIPMSNAVTAGTPLSPRGEPDAGKLTPLGTETPARPLQRSRKGLVVVGIAVAAFMGGAGLVVVKMVGNKATTAALSEPPAAKDARDTAASAATTAAVASMMREPAPLQTSEGKPGKGESAKKSKRATEPVTSAEPAASSGAEPPAPSPPSAAHSASAPTPPPSVAPSPAPSPAPTGGGFNAASCKAVQTGQVRAMGVNAKDLSMNGTVHAWTTCAQRSIKEKPPGPIPATVHIRFSDNRAFQGATCNGCPAALAQCVAANTKPTVSVSFRGGDVTGEPAFDVPVTFTCE